MIHFLSVILIALLLSILAGLIRVFRGPAPAERMLAAQLFGTASVAMLLVLSQVMQMPALLDVALVFAVLAAVTLVAFVVLAERGER
ncbi:MAG: pH regulation protein F [Roseinatronobacter sp.]|jgi:multicomponent Na+:H+ antiporter subunit F|nr:pH regulation protein F [Roseinatronobacter sp.]